ncbi:hypothetical protein ACFLYR_03835 [Chloroflexota bacterium]
MIYRVQKGDIARVVKVLADAFQRDPLWNKSLYTVFWAALELRHRHI